MQDDKKQHRPEAYPKPTETDQQLKNQDEFTEQSADFRSDSDDETINEEIEDLRQSTQDMDDKGPGKGRV